jgi:hypothetical protein
MAGSPAFARKSALSRWAAGSAEDDLHTERGRPQKARHADENARNDLQRERTYGSGEKKAEIDKALAKFKVGAKVSGSASAFKMKGKKGTVRAMERSHAGAFVYTIDVDGGGTERAVEVELQRA